MNNKENNVKTEKAKETLSNFWQKTSNVGKKAADGAKTFAEQTKKNIYDAQAKKYVSITRNEFFSEDFTSPKIIKIVDDLANRKFVTDDDAIGWIEVYENIKVLHMYVGFASNSNLLFIPAIKIENVYYAHEFCDNNFIDVNHIFKKTMDEKVAELEKIAYDLGARGCSVEIVESDNSSKGTIVGVKVGKAEMPIGGEAGFNKKYVKIIRGKTTSHWDGCDILKQPQLKWFEHNENIKNLIEMRFSDRNNIKSKMYELSGLTSVTMEKNVAGVIDSLSGLKGNVSMKSKSEEEHNSVLIYEIEF